MSGRWLVVLASVALIATLVWLKQRGWHRRKQDGRVPLHLLEGWRADRPLLVYFSGPGCSACRSQRDVLRQLQRQCEIAVLELDALQHREVAQAQGVRTVPTILLLSQGATVAYRHSGFISLHLLQMQVECLYSTAPPPA